MMSVPYSWTEDLIDLVLKEPALIDPAHHDYRNISKREQIWERVGEKLDTTGEDVKKRWRSLRDTYGRYVRRRRQFSGPGKLKKWVWADKMKPLRIYSTSSGDSDFPDPSPDTDGDCSADIANDQADEDQKATSSENAIFDPIIPEVMLATTSSPARGVKRRIGDQSSVDWGYFEEDKRAQADPIDLLFLAYASTVKTFSGKRQAITKHKIAQIIMEQELHHQEELGEN